MKKLTLFVTVITASMTSHAFSMESFKQEKEKENSVYSKRPISKASDEKPLTTEKKLQNQIESAEKQHEKFLEGMDKKIKAYPENDPIRKGMATFRAQIQLKHNKEMEDLTFQLRAIEKTLTK